MTNKLQIIISKQDHKDLIDYCNINGIIDTEGFVNLCFRKGLMIEKYGLLEKTLNGDEKDLKTGIVGEKQVEIEVIREIRVEVPVEIIKEVEVIKEVIVEKEVIKEVEKIVTITNNEELEENIFHLEKQLEEERKIFSIKTQELEKIFQKEMSKKDVELDEVRRNLDIKLDNTNEKMLQETLQKLRKELLEKDEKIKELTKLNQDQQNTKESKLNAIFLKGSNLK